MTAPEMFHGRLARELQDGLPSCVGLIGKAVGLLVRGLANKATDRQRIRSS